MRFKSASIQTCVNTISDKSETEQIEKSLHIVILGIVMLNFMSWHFTSSFWWFLIAFLIKCVWSLFSPVSKLLIRFFIVGSCIKWWDGKSEIPNRIKQTKLRYTAHKTVPFIWKQTFNWKLCLFRVHKFYQSEYREEKKFNNHHKDTQKF